MRGPDIFGQGGEAHRAPESLAAGGPAAADHPMSCLSQVMHGQSKRTSVPRRTGHLRGPQGPWFTSVTLLQRSVPHRKFRYKTGGLSLTLWHGQRHTATQPASVCPHAQGRGTRMGPVGPYGTPWDPMGPCFEASPTSLLHRSLGDLNDHGTRTPFAL